MGAREGGYRVRPGDGILNVVPGTVIHGEQGAEEAQITRNALQGAAGEAKVSAELVSEGRTIVGSQVGVQTEGFQVVDHVRILRQPLVCRRGWADWWRGRSGRRGDPLQVDELYRPHLGGHARIPCRCRTVEDQLSLEKLYPGLAEAHLGRQHRISSIDKEPRRKA